MGPVPATAGSPPELPIAIRQFNRGEYFACHETLEELWLAEGGRVRLLYQGILMIGVGLHLLQRRNLKGAVGLLERGSRQLQGFAPGCLGIDVQRLVRESAEVLRQLDSAGLEATLAAAGELFPRIHFRGSLTSDAVPSYNESAEDDL